MRQIFPAAGPRPAPIFDAVLDKDAPLDLARVETLAHGDGRQLRQAVALLGEETEAAPGELGLEVGAGVFVAGPARLEALLERLAQGLVERVDGEDGRRVVVVAALEPVVREAVEVEVVAGRVRARPDALERPLRDRDRREPGRRGEALLRAGVRVVDPPGVDVHLDAAERGDAVHDEERVRPGERAPELGDRLAHAGRRLGVDDREQARVRVLRVRGEQALDRHVLSPRSATTSSMTTRK